MFRGGKFVNKEDYLQIPLRRYMASINTLKGSSIWKFTGISNAHINPVRRSIW